MSAIGVRADCERLDACFLFNLHEVKLLIFFIIIHGSRHYIDALLRFLNLLSETADVLTFCDLHMTTSVAILIKRIGLYI